MSEPAELTTDRIGRADAAVPSWRWAIYGGAVLGGVFWGVVAAVTVGAPGDDARHAVIVGPRLTLAAGITVVCLIVGGLLIALTRTAPRVRLLRSLGAAVMIGPLGGWLIVASLALQGYALGWG